MGFFFDTPDHPLIAHLRTLIDAYGIDADGNIQGTTYSFTSERLYESGPMGLDEVLYINDADKYPGLERLFERASYLTQKASKQLEEDAIQERINSDIEKYLSKDSPLPEAKEDLKQMEFHKKEIIRIATKWQDKFTSLHL